VLAASHLLASGNGNCKGGRQIEIIREKNLFFLISHPQNKSRDVDLIWISLQPGNYFEFGNLLTFSGAHC